MLTKQEETELLARVDAYACAEINVDIATKLDNGTAPEATCVASLALEELIRYIRSIGSGA